MAFYIASSPVVSGLTAQSFVDAINGYARRAVTEAWDRRGKTRWAGVALTPDVFREPVTLDDCRTSKPGELRFAPFTALCRFEVEADRNNQRHMY